jgi:hypothetical protein
MIMSSDTFFQIEASEGAEQLRQRLADREQENAQLRANVHFFETVSAMLPITVFVKDAPHGRFVV